MRGRKTNPGTDGANLPTVRHGRPGHHLYLGRQVDFTLAREHSVAEGQVAGGLSKLKGGLDFLKVG